MQIQINMDRKKGIKRRIYWMLLAFGSAIRNFLWVGFNRSKLEAMAISTLPTPKFYDNGLSPSRSLTDQWLRSVLQEKFADNAVICIADIGGGNFRYMDLIANCLKDTKVEYHCIEQPSFKFKEEPPRDGGFIDYCDMNKEIPEVLYRADIIMSVSVLEHLDVGPEVVAKWLDCSKSGSVHLHQYPRFWSVFNYFWHGWGHIQPQHEWSIYTLCRLYISDFRIYRFAGIFAATKYLLFDFGRQRVRCQCGGIIRKSVVRALAAADGKCGAVLATFGILFMVKA